MCVCVCVSVEIIDCGEYDSMIEILGKLDTSYTQLQLSCVIFGNILKKFFGIKRTKYHASK